MEGVIVCSNMFHLALVERLLNEFLVVPLFANMCLIQASHSVNPGFQCFLLLHITVFNAFFEAIIKMGIQLIM